MEPFLVWAGSHWLALIAAGFVASCVTGFVMLVRNCPTYDD